MANATLRYQTKKSPTPHKNHPTTSCTSSNPGHPDMANATLRYQTKKSPTPHKNHPTTSCTSSNPAHPGLTPHFAIRQIN
ncbi:hypothetical protein PN471_15495 [Aphanizomenon sp. CS-733/32]|uniref:hypothetical protein n=1 Tax=Aphanizomenon sp. CS-733/32 TaxID=3021715 RepID=UPI00232F4DB9|nr:hypothetical protein [Aphanizomenon sp. CS-733/32]MDB9310011.1 hypothetical protein [Aphanizomenon sp. CS-733/32]